MSKNQKIEWITTAVLIVCVVSLGFAVILNFDLWGTSPVSPAEIILTVASIISAAVWLINYYVKTILALKRRTEPRFVAFVWLLAPLVISIGTSLLTNGANSFSGEFASWNIISSVGVFLMVVALVFYFYMFFGKRHMWVSLVIYCLLSFVVTLIREDMDHMHNYYLMCLFPMIVLGYLELFIRNKRMARSK